MERRAWVAVALAAALAAVPAKAQKGDALGPGAAGAEPVEAWSVRCPDDRAAGGPGCRAFQNMVMPGTEERLLTVVVEPSGESYRLALALPHGLYLPAGVEISIDGGEATRIVISTSDADGAYAAIDAGPELIAAMKAGRTMHVSFMSATRQDFTVPVTLSGFSAAMRRLE